MKTLKERFEEKIMYEPMSGCWLWIAALDSFGYGQFRIPNKKNMQKTNRISYELYIGPIPEKMCVCHHCDTPSCVNPKHLFLGSQQDNMNDMVSKKRGKSGQKTGEENSNSKLTVAAILDIRQRYKRGNRYHLGTIKELANLYGIHQNYVSKIAFKKVWKHI